MDILSISSLRARDLPRSLLRAPSPTLEFHTLPASPPHTILSPPPQNTTTPAWSDTISYTLPPHDTSIGFLIRDTPYPHPPLAHLTLSPRRALTQGWFPLLSSGNLPAGELFASLFCPTRCASKPIPEVPQFPPLPFTPDRDDEKRSVSPEPGRLFRSGRLRLTISAQGVPATSRPQLKIIMADQVLVGSELQHPLDNPLDSSVSASSTAAPSTVARPSHPYKLSAPVVEHALLTQLRKGKKFEPAGKALLKTADALRKRIADDHASLSPHRDDPNPEPQQPNHDAHTTHDLDALRLQQLQIDEFQSELISESAEEATPECDTTPECGATPMRRFSFRKHGVKQEAHPKKENTEVSARNPRRTVDFGSFELALFHGVTPRDITIQIQDSSSHLPERLTKLTDQKLELPDLNSLKCTCNNQCNTHLFAFQMSDRGDQSNKIVLRVTAETKTWTPIATDTIVTSRFRDVMAGIDDMADTFKDKFPNAENLTYLLVGGLFTKHYPTYFERNKQFLQEKLRLPRVQTVPIHTEGSIARNAKIIRDSIFKTCRGSKSVVLIGHSKGGLDAVSILDTFPETRRFVHGIISFQAPFGGTFLVDFVARSRLAVTAISSVIESLWKGDQASLLDLSYAARARSLQLSASESKGDTEVVSNGPQPKSVPAPPSSSVDMASWQDESCRLESNLDHDKLDVYRQVPIVSFASYASFHVLSIRSAANAAGVASMSPAAQRTVKHTGFLCDGLVTAGDARIPHADTVLLEDMMHTEPALYVQGTRYPPGQLTASAIVLLFEKLARNSRT